MKQLTQEKHEEHKKSSAMKFVRADDSAIILVVGVLNEITLPQINKCYDFAFDNSMFICNIVFVPSDELSDEDLEELVHSVSSTEPDKIDVLLVSLEDYEALGHEEYRHIDYLATDYDIKILRI